MGDWLVYGQERFPERYRRAVEETTLDYQTLRNYAWIARKFPPDRRRAELSMQHHAEVAALRPDEQDSWLERAQLHGWSRNELRRRVRSAVNPEAEARSLVAEIRLTISQARRSAWEDAAEQANCELADWVLDIVDAAVRSRVQNREPLRVVKAG